MKKFIFTLQKGVTLTIQPPTVRQYIIKLFGAKNYLELFEAISEIASRNDEGVTVDMEFIKSEFTVKDVHSFRELLKAWVESVRDADPELRTPYYPPEKRIEQYFSNATSDIKTVADYTIDSMFRIYDLDIFEFYALLHEAVVWSCNRTQEGREYLKNAYNRMQTKADFKRLAALAKGG